MTRNIYLTLLTATYATIEVLADLDFKSYHTITSDLWTSFDLLKLFNCFHLEHLQVMTTFCAFTARIVVNNQWYLVIYGL